MVRPPTHWGALFTSTYRASCEAPKVIFRKMPRGVQSLCHEYSPVSTYHCVTC